MPGSSRRTTKGYTLRGRKGQINYVGITSNPDRRQKQQRRAGKSGNLRVETGSMTRRGASIRSKLKCQDRGDAFWFWRSGL